MILKAFTDTTDAATAFAFNVGATEAARFDSSGRIRYDHTSNYMAFFTNGMETFRIASDGDLTVTSTTLVTNLKADNVDGYSAASLLDLANSTGDTDAISEGLTNLFYKTHAHAQH